jgi:hypothetical protein
MTLTEAAEHIGEPVVYTAPHGAREDGVITSVGATYVFVRYGGDSHSKATAPGQLTLANPQ